MSKDRTILVIQVGADCVRAVIARPGAEPVALLDGCVIPVGRRDGDTNPLRDQLLIDQLVSFCRPRRKDLGGVLFILGGSAVSCHYLETPPLSGRPLVQATRLKLSQQLHFPVDQAIVAVRPLNSTSEGQLRVHATAGQQDFIQSMVDAAAQLRLRLIGICAAPDALARAAAKHVGAAPGLIALLDVGERMSTLVVLDGGSPCVCADIPIAAADITAALMRPIIRGEEVLQLDEEQALQLRNDIGVPDPSDEIPSLEVTGDRILPLLEPVLQKLIKQLTQWLTFASSGRNQPVRGLEVIGVGASIRGFAGAIGARTGLSVTSGDWLDQQGTLSAEFSAGHCRGFGLSAAALTHWRDLPDLVPPETRREQKVDRVRRSVAVCAPIIAISIAAASVPFESLGSAVEQSVTVRKAQLATVQSSVTRCAESSRDGIEVARLEGRFQKFVHEAPAWLVVFKELSLILPGDLRAIEMVGEWSADAANLTLRADVVPASGERGFDEVVRQTVLMLQRSDLFSRVEIVSANQGPSERDRAAAGTVSIRLDLMTTEAGREGMQ